MDDVGHRAEDTVNICGYVLDGMHTIDYSKPVGVTRWQRNCR